MTIEIQRGREVTTYGLKTPWSLRDNPAALAVALIGVLGILIVLGCLTVRIGSLWIRTYAHRQMVIGE